MSPRPLDLAAGAGATGVGVGNVGVTGVGTWSREPGTVTCRASAVPPGADAPFVIIAESHVSGVPTEWEPHTHPLHELVWVRGGTLVSRVADRVFTVSEGQGLWMPAGVVHGGRLTAGVAFHDAFFAPERTPVAFDGPTAIEMTPLLESLLTHLVRTDLDAAARARAESVVFDVLLPSERQLALQLPGDARIDVIAETLLEDPSDPRSLEEWARTLGTSDRTITRAFRHSTGLSFAQWRQALRVHRALTLLSEGFDVQTVALLLGYAQTSTFIAAFRRVMGTTPGAFSRTSAEGPEGGAAVAVGPSGVPGVRNAVSTVSNS
ncbi:AraC family transcriptional regulator [Streptomyces sp. CFMR 7]|uniref:helix-turn-helix domain-containing protein n=1 Tax=Streptomyces sp. CFMR 7 TaxID=1649184 RepID=UPI0021B6E583|nr:AraC family transcriptional regulator [Streptomyces sp. CFMR 7]